MKGLRAAYAACVAMACALPAWAEDIALVLTNTQYQSLPGIYENLSARGIATSLQANGFRVVDGRDLDGFGLRQSAVGFERLMAQNPDRVVVVLSGHFASYDGKVWMLGQNARLPSRITVGEQGLSVSAIADILSVAQGRGLLMLVDGRAPFPAGNQIVPGSAGLSAPQGITLVRGDGRGIRTVLDQGFFGPGKSFAEVAHQAPATVTMSGYLPSQASFSPRPSSPYQDPAQIAETAYWEVARDIGTVEAANAYLRRYPSGRYVHDAGQMVNDILNAGLRQVQQAEHALNLSREARKGIQRELSLLGFNPHGIDGVFGRGTRAALVAWQRSRSFEDHGFLTAPQVRALHRQAEQRAAELAEEARKRQEDLERQDRAYWHATGNGGNEPGLRNYLRRYPDGLFSDQARNRLTQIENGRNQNAALAERKAWKKATQIDTMASYQGFLNRYPNSQFVAAARARMGELQDLNSNRALMEQAQAQENAIVTSQVTRLLIERRLQQIAMLGANQVDGTFNDKTRRAIRKFQRSRNIHPTGFVTQITMVQLLAAQ